MVKRFNLYKEKVFKTDSDLKAQYLAPKDLKYIEIDGNFWKMLGEMIAGSKCIALVKEGMVVSYLWANEKNLQYFGIKKRLLPGECMLYNATTKIDLRGNGYAEILRAKAYEMLNKEVYYSFSDIKNKPALRFKEKIGAEVIGKYRYVKFWKFERCHEII